MIGSLTSTCLVLQSHALSLVDPSRVVAPTHPSVSTGAGAVLAEAAFASAKCAADARLAGGAFVQWADTRCPALLEWLAALAALSHQVWIAVCRIYQWLTFLFSLLLLIGAADRSRVVCCYSLACGTAAVTVLFCLSCFCLFSYARLGSASNANHSYRICTNLVGGCGNCLSKRLSYCTAFQ